MSDRRWYRDRLGSLRALRSLRHQAPLQDDMGARGFRLAPITRGLP